MQQKTILIIDDEIEYAEGIIDALQFEGYKVLTATTGDSALSQLKTRLVDLVMVDIMMPPGKALEAEGVKSDSTGIFLCKKIKTLYPRIPIICLSVVSNKDTIREIENLNIRFLRKGEVPLATILDVINVKFSGKSFPPKLT